MQDRLLRLPPLTFSLRGGGVAELPSRLLPLSSSSLVAVAAACVSAYRGDGTGEKGRGGVMVAGPHGLLRLGPLRRLWRGV